MTKKCNRLRGERPKAFWGALVGGAMNLIGGAISSKAQARAIRRQIEAQKEAAQTQLELANNSNLASTLNSYAAATRSYNDEDDYNLKYRLGGNKRLGSNRIYITDGGDATKIGSDTYLLRGGSHEQTNETGQTGIGINVGGNEIEAEGGEVAQKKNGALRIFSAQPILGNGMSPAQAILRGYNKDKVFSQQQAFKKRNGLKDDGSKAQWGMGVGTNRALQKSTKNGTRSIRSMWNSAKIPLSYTPIVGTAMDGYQYIRKPSVANFVPFTIGLASDIAGMKWLKGTGKATNYFERGLKASGHIRSKRAPRGLIAGTLELDDTGVNYIQNKKRLGGGLTSKDRGSSKHPYPSVSSKDFAGGGRSYPIPTKADAVDALRLAGLHGRSDVKAKVYSRYPELRKKAAFGDWVRTNRDDNVLANLLYESGLFDRESWKTALRDIHVFTGMGGDPYNTDENVDAVMTPAFGSSSTRVLSQLSKSPEASYTLKQVLGLPTKEMVRKRIAGDIAKRIGVARAARQSSNFRNYNIARMQAANAEGSFSPFANQVRYAEGKPILVNTNGYYTTARNTISRNAKNMTSGTNPFLYAPKTSDEVLEGLNRVITSAKQGAKKVGQKVGNKFKGTPGQKLSDAYYGLTPMQRAKLKGLTLAATLSVPAGYFVESQNGKNNKTVSVQKDAHGKPISQYIARPQAPAPVQAPAKQPSRTQVKKAVPTQKDTVIPRQIKKTVPQKSNTVPSRVNTTPQYKGNVTKGNYQLHDGETRTINGIKYTRRGNTIINHKTNVAYVYDKRGNYTGQADYSKVGNFNQAFDAARAAGRKDFIYRAGKYQKYTTNKETDAKKERLNRIIGARRMAKALGGYSRPVKGMRPKAAIGIYTPFNKRYTSIYDAPDYDDINGGSVLGNKEVTVTAKRIKPTFMKPNNDAMSLIDVPKEEVPYIPQKHNRSRAIFSGGDYLGLGIDTLSALGTGLITSNAYKNLDFNYSLPNFVEESPVALNTTYHNEAQKSNVERNRLNSRNSILRNTMSGSTAVGRMQSVDTNALYQLNQLADEKTNKETELMNQNLLNEQQVRARNAAAKNQYYNTVASIKNAALEAKNNASLARSQAFNTSLSGLSQAWTNFWTAGRTAYEDDQTRRAMIASSKEATPTRLSEMDFDLSPDILASLYKTSKDAETKRFYLSRLSPKQRLKYGIY